MESFDKFLDGLEFVGIYVFKLFIIIAIVLFILIFINIFLKRFNFSWSQKYVKKIDEIISSADGLKSIVKSFEKLVNILFNAIAGVINLFALFIDVTFISVNKFILSPLEILINYMNFWGKKFEKFNDDLKQDLNEDENSGKVSNEKKDSLTQDQQNSKNEEDNILDKIFDKKSKGNK